MAKEPTKKDLLKRIEALERKVEDLRIDRIIDNKDSAGLEQLFAESLEKGRQRRVKNASG